MDQYIEDLYRSVLKGGNRTFLTSANKTWEIDVVDYKVETNPFAPARIKMDAFVKPPRFGTPTVSSKPLLRDGWAYLAIKDVIFNPPATIVLWKDGTKTVVRCGENDTYSKEHGLAMAICKKALGNKGNYNNQFKKWLKEEKQ